MGAMDGEGEGDEATEFERKIYHTEGEPDE